MKKALLMVLLLVATVITTAMDSAPDRIITPAPTNAISTLPFMVNEQELTCLATNIYREAGWESTEGKLAVATVTMNRVRHSEFPKSICEVVYQRNPRGCQFSWVCQQTSPMNPRKYEEALGVARQVLHDNARHRSLRLALFYHADYVSPDWAADMTRIVQIGAHIFYDPRKPEVPTQEGGEESHNDSQEEDGKEDRDEGEASQNHGHLPDYPALPEQG